MRSKHKNLSFEFIILLGLPLVTFAVSPWLSFDPINPIKMFFLISISLFALLKVKNFWLIIRSSFSKNFQILILFFLLALSAPLLFAPAPFSQQFWGYFGRNTGYLTYVSLLIILILSSVSQIKSFTSNFIKVSIFCGAVMSLYCLMQVLNIDPIEWKEKLAFGTFGNINFSSAFLGLSSIIAFSSIFTNNFSKMYKFLFLIILSNNIFLILKSNSIQGLAILAFGSAVSIFFIIRENFKSTILKSSYFVAFFLSSILALLSLFNLGPLAKFFYNNNIKFRQDYWEAGLELTFNYPLTGVGLDSYGDWYRYAREPDAALGENFDRISTSAHNVFLDLSSGGGFPLFLAYLSLILYTLKMVAKYVKSNNIVSIQFVSIFSAWCGYLLFTLISINNIGVAIWGWVINGLLIGLCRNSSDVNYPKTLKSRRSIPNLKIMAALILSLLLGMTPYKADLEFRNSLESGEMARIISTSSEIGSTTFHRETALIILDENGYKKEATLVAKDLLNYNSRSFIGWNFLYSTEPAKSPSRAKIMQNLILIEPRYKP